MQGQNYVWHQARSNDESYYTIGKNMDYHRNKTVQIQNFPELSDFRNTYKNIDCASSFMIIVFLNSAYRISVNSFRGNYSFLEVGVRQLFKGGNYKFLNILHAYILLHTYCWNKNDRYCFISYNLGQVDLFLFAQKRASFCNLSLL